MLNVSPNFGADRLFLGSSIALHEIVLVQLVSRLPMAVVEFDSPVGEPFGLPTNVFELKQHPTGHESFEMKRINHQAAYILTTGKCFSAPTSDIVR
jgi:hypothetical protein